MNLKFIEAKQAKEIYKYKNTKQSPDDGQGTLETCRVVLNKIK
jgi:hypothetical protein